MIGLLADVGKARLPGAMFEKPGALTAAEYSVVKKHVEHSLAILRESPDVPEELMVGVAQHHERMDGSGYPKGLSGAEISVYGRMAGIADTFAAMTTDRPYAEAMTPYRALTSLFEWADKSFHAPLVEQFVQAIGVFPVGSMIELSSGEVAVVLAHNLVRRLEPRVLVLTDADKQPLADPVARDLLEKSDDEDEQRVYILKGLPPGAYGIEPRDYYIDASQSSDPAV
jgi:HD-GYP domain-containing protein (c-di-GMP phosphodiesterase class II)